jgi:hypothetical protein
MKPGSLEKLTTRSKTPHTDTLLARVLRSSGRVAMRRAKLITAAAAVIIAVSIAGINRIEINDNPVRWFKANHPIRVADQVLNDHFAGTYDAFVVLTHEDDDALPAFMNSAHNLLSGVNEESVSGIYDALGADTAEIGAWYGSVIAAVDDALFDAGSDETIAALEELMFRAEEAQVQSKYFQKPDALHYIGEIQAALNESGHVGKSIEFLQRRQLSLKLCCNTSHHTDHMTCGTS